MYFNGSITFRNTSSSLFGLIVSEMPVITHADIVSTEYDIPNRDGVLYGKDSKRSNAEISVKFVLVTDTYSNYSDKMRSIRKWLNGTGKLTLSNNPGYYYQVQKATIVNDDRHIVTFGEFEVCFTVYPFEFLDDQTQVNISGSISYNNDGDIAKPIYTVTKSDTSVSTIKIGNRAAFSITGISGTITIDTNKMIVTHSTQGYIESYVSGDYENLWLAHGAQTIAVTNATVKMLPNKGVYL
jgi:phage-related protein